MSYPVFICRAKWQPLRWLNVLFMHLKMDCALTESGNCLVVCIVIAQQCEEEEENSKVKFLHNISFHHHSSQGRSDVFSIKPLKRSNKRNFTASISPLSCAVGNFLKRAEKYSATTEKYLGTQSSARARMCVCMHARALKMHFSVLIALKLLFRC